MVKFAPDPPNSNGSYFLLTFNFAFLYPATLKSVGYYVIPSVQKFAFECPSVCLFIRQRFVSALYLEHFLTNFLQTLYKS